MQSLMIGFGAVVSSMLPFVLSHFFGVSAESTVGSAIPPVVHVAFTIGAFVLGDGQWFMPSWQTIAVVAYIALVPMSVGNVAWFAIVGMLPVNVAGLSSIMVPMVAMVSGALVHGEPLGLSQWAAMACCGVSLWLVMLRGRP